VEKLRKFFQKRGLTISAAAIATAVSANSVQAAPVGLAKTATAVALTKGAAASASISMLVKGAIKWMAWAKAKTAATVGGILLVGMGAGIVAVEAGQHVDASGAATGPDISGAWEGTITGLKGFGVKRTDSPHSRVVLWIQKTNGVYKVFGDSIDLGVKGKGGAKVTYHFPILNLDMEDKGWLNYELTVNATATEMTARAPGLGTTVLLKRTDTPDMVPERLTESDFASRAGSGLQGYWTGNASVIAMNWKIAEQPDGNYRSELAFSGFGANHLPVAVTNKAGLVTLKPWCGAGMFQGRLNAAGDELKGWFYLKGYSIPADLKRTEYKSEPVPTEDEYAFSSKMDLQGHWKTVVDLNLLQIVTDGSLRKYPLNLDIAKGADGAYSTTLFAPLATMLAIRTAEGSPGMEIVGRGF
jgi:hypothetical protein